MEHIKIILRYSSFIFPAELKLITKLSAVLEHGS
jgi:hypothetical protein